MGPAERKSQKTPKKPYGSAIKTRRVTSISLKSKRVRKPSSLPSKLSLASVAKRTKLLRCNECHKICSSLADHQAHLACHVVLGSIARSVTSTVDPHQLQSSRLLADQPYSRGTSPDDALRDISTALVKLEEEIPSEERSSEF
jgi:hypothetical protein